MKTKYLLGLITLSTSLLLAQSEELVKETDRQGIAKNDVREFSFNTMQIPHCDNGKKTISKSVNILQIPYYEVIDEEKNEYELKYVKDGFENKVEICKDSMNNYTLRTTNRFLYDKKGTDGTVTNMVKYWDKQRELAKKHGTQDRNK